MTKKILAIGSLALLLFTSCNFFQKDEGRPSKTSETATPPPVAEPTMPPAKTSPVTPPASTTTETIMPGATPPASTTTTPPPATAPVPMPSATPPATPPATAPPPPPPATLETKVINMESGNFFFKPSSFTVKKNQPVKIIFKNTGIHTFTIDALTVNVSLTGSSGVATFTPTKTGAFQYYCAIDGHAKLGMVGTMTVTE